MKIYYCDHFVLPLPPGHRFPMAKYALVLRRLIESGLASRHQLVVPDAATDEQLLLVHSTHYVERATTGRLTEREIRRIGFPWSPELIERARRSVGGTIGACRGALDDGAAVNLAGGTHHAFPGSGEGFCVFNDAAVAARTLQAELRVSRVLIIDCDVHQGNGTAAIFADDPSVFTFSIHGANNFPFRKVAGDLDIALPDGTGGAAYLEALESGLVAALRSAKADLAVYLAGADPYEGDRYGKLALTLGDLEERDRRVYGLCRGANTPVATVMSGGYAADVRDIVEIHFGTVRLAAEHSEQPASAPGGPGDQLRARQGHEETRAGPRDSENGSEVLT